MKHMQQLCMEDVETQGELVDPAVRAMSTDPRTAVSVDAQYKQVERCYAAMRGASLMVKVSDKPTREPGLPFNAADDLEYTLKLTKHRERRRHCTGVRMHNH